MEIKKNKSEIGFCLMRLIEHSKQQGERFIHPNADSFMAIAEFFKILVDDIYYEVSVEKDSDYIWFFFDYGKAYPRDDKLTNIETGDKKDNPRETSEAELLDQLFCLYYYSKKILYLSNLNKKGLIKTVLKKKAKRNYSIENFYKTKEQFVEIIKSVEEISFSEERNLFNHDSKERKALRDLTGTNTPEDFKITAKYSTNKIKSFLTRLFNAKSRDSLKNLFIRGIDEDNFSIIFNNDSFIKKFLIKLNKDKNGKFNPELVKESLLKEIA